MNDTGGSATEFGTASVGRHLTSEQWYVLNEAVLAHPLAVVLNGWAPPSPDWRSKARHVSRLSAAAESLVRAGLIEVYQEQLGPGESELLSGEEALAVVGSRDNWWRDDGVSDRRSEEQGNYTARYYTVAITEAGRLALSSWPCSQRFSRYSV